MIKLKNLEKNKILQMQSQILVLKKLRKQISKDLILTH